MTSWPGGPVRKECPYCGRSFGREGYYVITAHIARDHFVTEEKQSAYRCSVVGCGKRFYSGRQGVRHYRDEHKEFKP